MSRNNEVGNIPIITPQLWKIQSVMYNAYQSMNDNEIKELGKEIKAVNNSNCSSNIKDTADMLKSRVEAYIKEFC